MSAISPVVQQMRGPLETTPMETAQQNKAGHLTSGKDAARAMRDSLTGENSLEVSAGNDSVTISGEGRAMQQRMAADQEPGREKGPDGEHAPGAKESIRAAGLAESGEEELSATEQIIRSLKEQIAAVKEKLEKAKQRLAEATATSGGTGGTAPIEPSGENGPSEQAAQAMAQSMGSAMGRNAEAEAIQGEIEMLNQQLQILNQKLQETIRDATGGGMSGSAGIGGAGGPGGKGERISVTA